MRRAANRAIALHSTGPKTEAGKQHSSQNAIKHGFYSKSFLIRDDERLKETKIIGVSLTLGPRDNVASQL